MFADIGVSIKKTLLGIRKFAAPYMGRMPKRPYEDEATRLAKARRQLRAKMVQSGMLPGLFVKGTKTLRPEIKALIDKAVAEKAREK